MPAKFIDCQRTASPGEGNNVGGQGRLCASNRHHHPPCILLAETRQASGPVPPLGAVSICDTASTSLAACQRVDSATQLFEHYQASCL